MKPTLNQQKLLKKYLRKNLDYNETCIEFYDHILTAIEDITEGTFEDAVNRVINTELGGFEAMIAAEERYKRQTVKEMQRRYFGYIMESFKFPLVGVIGISSLMVYYAVHGSWFSFTRFFLVLFSLAIIPSLLNGIRYFRSGYILGTTNQSVKDDGFRWLKYLPGITFAVILLLNVMYLGNYDPAKWISHANPIILTTILMLYAIHAFAYYKMYRDEYVVTIVR